MIFIDHFKWLSIFNGCYAIGEKFRIISPCLLTMTLRGLEKALKNPWPIKNPQKINIVTYADDFIVSGASKEVLENEVKPIIVNFLKERGLKLSFDKTKISNIHVGFDFLGFNVRKYKKKLLIKPSRKSVLSFLKRLREVIKDNRTAKTEILIRQLNSKIRGWSNYYRHVVSKEIFGYIDNTVFYSLWKWCRRRHPNKGRKWIKRRYFKTLGNTHWNFGVLGPPGSKGLFLVKASKTPIRRHVKIKALANPFNPEYFDYFRKRSYKLMPGRRIGLKKA